MHPSIRMHSFFVLAVFGITLTACGHETDGRLPLPKGSCFEVFGPSNASHSDPAHDFGTVDVGSSGELTVRFHNFCNDQAAEVVNVELLDAKSDSPFAITASPTVGSLVGVGAINTITFEPTKTGTFSGIFRFTVSHGYYDVKLSGEAAP
jgi:hypothetical protein